jgi:hypothetical protein
MAAQLDISTSPETLMHVLQSELRFFMAVLHMYKQALDSLLIQIQHLKMKRRSTRQPLFSVQLAPLTNCSAHETRNLSLLRSGYRDFN